MENNLKKETIDSFNLDIFFQLHGMSKYAKSDSDFQVIFEREMKELNARRVSDYQKRMC